MVKSWLIDLFLYQHFCIFFTDMIGLGPQIFNLFFKMLLKSFHSDKIYPYIYRTSLNQTSKKKNMLDL